MTLQLTSTDTMETARIKLQALREMVYPVQVNAKKPTARISALRYIEWHYHALDSIPTDQSVIEYLQMRNYRCAKRITEGVFGELEAQGILTGVGQYSGHRHLTERGYEYYAN